MRSGYLIGIVVFALLISGCGGQADGPIMEPGMMGPGNGMSGRHHAQVPPEYAELKSPQATEALISNGQTLYTKLCASCHGDGGMGDGPAAASLNPVPAPVAHTSMMLGDGYLYWRITEGGADFKSTMPAWKSSLTEDDIWALIAYMRALGTGAVQPEKAMGGSTYNPESEAIFHEEILAEAVKQDLITQTEANVFLLVHDAVDEYRTTHFNELPSGSADELQTKILAALVKDNKITQSQADSFAHVHDLLLEAGLME